MVDRSNDWGPIYDDVVARVSLTSDLVILPSTELSDEDSYARATEVIIDEAKRAAVPKLAYAILVWDGQSRGTNDFAEQFFKLAYREEMKLRVVLTL